jgi:hypothetical protein
VFTINYAAMKYPGRLDQMNHLDGDEARMDIGRETCRVYGQSNPEAAVVDKKSARGFGYATELHVRNFIECVRTRQKPTAPVALGFQAALVVQLANISLKSGRRAKWDAAASKVVL